jgi:hypothetical protein
LPPATGELYQRLAGRGVDKPLQDAIVLFDLVANPAAERLPPEYRMHMALAAKHLNLAAISQMTDGLQKEATLKQVELLNSIIGDEDPSHHGFAGGAAAAGSVSGHTSSANSM